MQLCSGYLAGQRVPGRPDDEINELLDHGASRRRAVLLRCAPAPWSSAHAPPGSVVLSELRPPPPVRWSPPKPDKSPAEPPRIAGAAPSASPDPTARAEGVREGEAVVGEAGEKEREG